MENKQSCVSAHGEHIPSTCNSAVAIFFFSYRISSLIWASTYSSAQRDTILRHRKQHTCFCDDHGSEAPVIQIKKIGLFVPFSIKSFTENVYSNCNIETINGK